MKKTELIFCLVFISFAQYIFFLHAFFHFVSNVFFFSVGTPSVGGTWVLNNINNIGIQKKKQILHMLLFFFILENEPI